MAILIASALLNDVGKVAHVISRPGDDIEVGADLLLVRFAVPPLLPIQSAVTTLRHGLENENETAGATPFAIGEVLLLATHLERSSHVGSRLSLGGIAFLLSGTGIVEEKRDR